MSSPALNVAIVAYRCEGMLRECLQSLRSHPPSREMTVRVVDNASRDGTAEMVAREFPEVHLTVSRTNLGFGSASNLAIRRTTAPYLLFLNPDTRVTEGALDRLLDLMEEHREIGISGCRLQLDDGGFDHASKRAFPTPLSALGHFTGVGRRRDKGILAAYRAPEIEAGRVDAVNGAFMLIRREALEKVGVFDERYWMYMEDLDLCYRFAEAGWITWYEPSATVMHVKAGTSGPVRSPRLNYAFHYGMFRFYRKHYASRRNVATNAVVYLGIVVKLLLSIARNAVRRRRFIARGAT
jgi:N-acetylglucosaminyl-diphospho-decaprenol L-rhamnosyltransferase